MRAGTPALPHISTLVRALQPQFDYHLPWLTLLFLGLDCTLIYHSDCPFPTFALSFSPTPQCTITVSCSYISLHPPLPLHLPGQTFISYAELSNLHTSTLHFSPLAGELRALHCQFRLSPGTVSCCRCHVRTMITILVLASRPADPCYHSLRRSGSL